MARRGFMPARRTGSTVPRVQTQLYKTAEAIVIGSLVVTDANGELVVCSADPTAIKGVALQAAGTNLGYQEPYSAQTVFATGREQSVSIAIADDDQEFSCRMENGGAVVVPLQTHIGTEYGTAKDADGQWYVDETEVTTKTVRVTDIVPAQGGALGYHIVRFLAASHLVS